MNSENRGRPTPKRAIALLLSGLFVLIGSFAFAGPAFADVNPAHGPRAKECRNFTSTTGGPYAITSTVRACFKVKCLEKGQFDCRVQGCIRVRNQSFQQRFLMMELDWEGSDPVKWKKTRIGQNSTKGALCFSSKRTLKTINMRTCQVSGANPSVCGSVDWWNPK